MGVMEERAVCVQRGGGGVCDRVMRECVCSCADW